MWKMGFSIMIQERDLIFQYDSEYNLARLYNYYMGSVGILYGDEKIYQLYKKLKLKKNEWKDKLDKLTDGLEKNLDITAEKKELTIVGEFQFGNWALTYRDLFRLLNADNNPGIDFYIYITAMGKLSSMLSKQTVSYKNANNIIKENLSILKTPMWVIGLDIEEQKV